jgi:ADP-ribosylglycohydrolase
MIGAIIGDIAGSSFEHRDAKPDTIRFFEKGSSVTDDSVLTLAMARAILEFRNQEKEKNSGVFYRAQLHAYGRRYPDAGYGQSFKDWLAAEDPRPYHSFGNGSAMRVSPIGYAFPTLSETLVEAKKSAAVTHNHPDGIKGAQAVAGCVHLAWHGADKDRIRDFVEKDIGYSLDFNLEDLHRNYQFEIQCARSVPQAIFAFLESADFANAIRNALYIGGDSDTMACIAGAVAGAFYKSIPGEIIDAAAIFLDAEQKKLIREFNAAFGIAY